MIHTQKVYNFYAERENRTMKKTNKFLVLLLVMLMAVSVFMTGCGSDEPSGNEGQEGDASTLVIAIQEEIEGTDIQQIGWENIVHALIYEPLVKYNADLSEMVPCFAESYEIAEDGLSITFTLPADAKFSNGDVLDAEAVKASFERFLAISEYAGDLDAVESIEALDAVNVRFNLTQPAPYMWASVTSTYGGLVNVAKAEEIGDEEFNRCAVSNGLYYVEDWQAGSQIILAKNPNYKCFDPNVTNKGVAAFDKVIVRFIPDEFTRVSELESGNVDIIWDVPTASIADLQANADLTTYMYKQAGVSYMQMNTEDPVLSDINVRKAINIGIDRDTLAKVLNDVVNPEYGFISAAQAGYSTEKAAAMAEEYKYDAEAAKALLKEAGYEDTNGDGFVDKDGQNLTIEYLTATDVATSRATAPVIQEQLKAIGIDLQITEYESAYIKQLQRENDYQMAARRFVWNDADILYYVFTEASGYPWSDPEVSAALDEARYIVDPAERIKGYEKFHDEIMNEMPAVALYSDNYCVASTNAVKGMVITNDGRPIFNDVAK